MKPGFFVTAEGVVDPGQLQPHPGELRSFRKNRLEPLGCPPGKAEPRLDEAEQKHPLDALLVVFGPCLLQKLERVLYPSGSVEELSSPDG